ncbi:MAG: hypothetical protein ACOY3Y_12230 [Acidobacteriota bacterium]
MPKPRKPKRPSGFGVEFKITDEIGDGPFPEVVLLEPQGGRSFPILFVHFDEPAGIGSRFTYEGIVWELVKENESYEGLWIPGKNTSWDAEVIRGEQPLAKP